MQSPAKDNKMGLPQQQIMEAGKHVADGAAAGTMLGSLLGYLPEAAALFTIVWTLFRIIEMWTGKKIHELRKSRAKVKKS
jgi:hypothetical protein